MIINTDLVYPIGSIYLSVNATNPSKYFGGTWEQITSDAYLKIVTSNAGSLGGTSSDHKIPVTSMPPHTHQVQQSHPWNSKGTKNYHLHRVENDYLVEFNLATSSTGGGQPYYPYYYGVYVFKRTA